jgi:hypothetical protein
LLEPSHEALKRKQANDLRDGFASFFALIPTLNTKEPFFIKGDLDGPNFHFAEIDWYWDREAG